MKKIFTTIIAIFCIVSMSSAQKTSSQLLELFKGVPVDQWFSPNAQYPAPSPSQGNDNTASTYDLVGGGALFCTTDDAWVTVPGVASWNRTISGTTLVNSTVGILRLDDGTNNITYFTTELTTLPGLAKVINAFVEVPTVIMQNGTNITMTGAMVTKTLTGCAVSYTRGSISDNTNGYQVAVDLPSLASVQAVDPTLDYGSGQVIGNSWINFGVAGPFWNEGSGINRINNTTTAGAIILKFNYSGTTTGSAKMEAFGHFDWIGETNPPLSVSPGDNIHVLSITSASIGNVRFRGDNLKGNLKFTTWAIGYELPTSLTISGLTQQPNGEVYLRSHTLTGLLNPGAVPGVDWYVMDVNSTSSVNVGANDVAVLSFTTQATVATIIGVSNFDNSVMSMKIVTVTAVSCTNTGITLSAPSSITTLGGMALITTSGLPSYTWSLSDPSLATLTATTLVGTGELKAKRNGVLTITATHFDGNCTFSGSHVINISGQIDGLTLTGSSTIVCSNTEDSQLLSVASNLSATTLNDLSWSIMPTSIAGLISGSFNLQAKNNGVVTVVAMSVADNTIMSNPLIVTISNFIPITGATLTGAAGISTNKGTAPLTLTYEPANATKPALSYASTSDCGAGINSSGLVTARYNGNYTLTGTVRNGGSQVSGMHMITVSNQNHGFYETFDKPYDGNPFSSLAGNQEGGGGYWDGSNSALNPWAHPSYKLLPNPTNGSLSLVVTRTAGSTDGAIQLDGAPFAGSSYAYVATGFDKSAGFPWNWGCGVELNQGGKNVKMSVQNNSSIPVTLYIGVGTENGNDVFGSGRIESYSVVLAANTTTEIEQAVNTNYAKYLKLGVGQLTSGVSTVNVVFDYISIGQPAPTSLTFSNTASNAVINTKGGTFTISGAIVPFNAPQEVVDWQLMQPAGKPALVTLARANALSAALTATGLANGVITLAGKAATGSNVVYHLVTITNQVIDSVQVQFPSNFASATTPGTVLTVTAVIYPLGFPVQTVEFSSSVPSVLGINAATGVVTINGPGKTIISVVSQYDTDKSASYEVTVGGIIAIPTTTGLNLTKNEISVYPNPSTGTVNVVVEDLVSVSVVNAVGAEVYATKESVLYLAGLPKGLYIVRIVTAKGAASVNLSLE